MRIAALVLLSSFLLAQSPARKQRDAGWTVTFADEFDGPELDLSKWSPHDPAGGRAGSAEAVTMSGGQLHIGASGTVTTFGTFSQANGRFEIRCKAPSASGLRAGFRLLPATLAPLPKIDVIEVAGDSPSKAIFANRWGTEQTERSFGDSFAGPDLSAGFHTFAIEWDKDSITWSIDGKDKFRSEEGIPREPMFLQLELQGGSGAPAGFFEIDYVRVSRR